MRSRILNGSVAATRPTASGRVQTPSRLSEYNVSSINIYNEGRYGRDQRLGSGDSGQDLPAVEGCPQGWLSHPAKFAELGRPTQEPPPGAAFPLQFTNHQNTSGKATPGGSLPRNNPELIHFNNSFISLAHDHTKLLALPYNHHKFKALTLYSAKTSAAR